MQTAVPRALEHAARTLGPLGCPSVMFYPNGAPSASTLRGWTGRSAALRRVAGPPPPGPARPCPHRRALLRCSSRNFNFNSLMEHLRRRAHQHPERGYVVHKAGRLLLLLFNLPTAAMQQLRRFMLVTALQSLLRTLPGYLRVRCLPSTPTLPARTSLTSAPPNNDNHNSNSNSNSNKTASLSSSTWPHLRAPP